MPDISFDDLIPAKGGATASPPPSGGGITFDDLIPKRPAVTVGPGLPRDVGVSAPEPTPEQFKQDDADIAARKAGVPGKGGSADAPMMGIVDPKTGQLTWSAAPNDVPSALPTIARTADDAARSVASGATFGLADEAAAGAKTLLGDKSYADNVATERARDKEIPWYIRMPGEIGGGLMTGTGLSRAGISLLNGAAPTIGSMALRGAGEGALYGAASGFGRGEGMQDRFMQAAYGSGLGALTGGVTGAVAGKMASSAARKSVPTPDELKAMSGTNYDAARAAGVAVNPSSYGDFVDNLVTLAQKEGIDKTLHPGATAALNRLLEAKENGTPLTLENVDTLRQVIKDAAGSNSPGERRLASIMVDRLDDFVNGLKPADVVAGDPMKAVSALNQARDLWSRARKGEIIDDLLDRAKIRASQFSGSGEENAIRTEFRQIAMNPKKMRGFTEDEQDAIRRVAMGGPIENFLRMVGKFAPTGVVSSALSGGIGYGAGGPIGAVVLPTVGFGARQAATAMTRNNVNAVSDLVRSGGSLPSAPLSDWQLAALRAALIGEANEAPSLLNGGHVNPEPTLLGPRVSMGR
jgi:hypothetical protein